MSTGSLRRWPAPRRAGASRCLGVAAMLLSVGAACGPSPQAGMAPTPPATRIPPATASPRPPADARSCTDPFEGAEVAFPLSPWAETDFCRHAVDVGEILPGGQPRDGIPPLLNPQFEDVEAASAWMEDGWPVLAVVGVGETLGFPLPILVWHEVVNAVLDNEPIVVTYSPLSGSARAYRSRGPGGEDLVFGSTGNLRFGNPVLYDRSTATWWQQISGKGIVGELTGFGLAPLPSQILPWSLFRQEFPLGQVLSQDTGFVRDYGSTPYAGLEGSEELPALVRGFEPPEPDPRLPPMERVTVLLMESASIVYPFPRLVADGVINDVAGGVPLVVLWVPGALSIADAPRVSQSREVGSSAAFGRELDGQILTFERSATGLRDLETGTRWGLTGRGLDGPLRGSQLARLVQVEAYWYAWSSTISASDLRSP